jgi:hypothetical protein
MTRLELRDELWDAMMDRDYEAWRPALIAFYRAQGPWFQSVRNLEAGWPLTSENKHDIDGLIAAMEAMREAA